jgi:hypothetical protein
VEGTKVEFETEVEKDKIKAVRVTAPGGEPLEPPPRKRRTTRAPRKPLKTNGVESEDAPKATEATA